MFACEVCPFEAKSKGGLAGHVRAKHPGEKRMVSAGSVLEAVSAQLPEDGPPGLLAAALRLAAAMDVTDSTRDLSSLSRELRAVLAEIGDGEDESEADGVDDLAARRDARRANAQGGVGSSVRF